MLALSLHIIPAASKTVVAFVKKNVLLTDSNAQVILFGSRASCNAETESDWDFLVITQQENTNALADELRKIILRKDE